MSDQLSNPQNPIELEGVTVKAKAFYQEHKKTIWYVLAGVAVLAAWYFFTRKKSTP